MRKYVCLFWGIVLIFSMAACRPLGKEKDYLEAKDETTVFFSKHKDKFLSAVDEIERSHSPDDIKINGIELIWYNEEGANATVTFYKEGYGLITGGSIGAFIIVQTTNRIPTGEWNLFQVRMKGASIGRKKVEATPM